MMMLQKQAKTVKGVTLTTTLIVATMTMTELMTRGEINTNNSDSNSSDTNNNDKCNDKATQY